MRASPRERPSPQTTRQKAADDWGVSGRTLHIAIWPELSLIAGEAVAAALPVDARDSPPNDVFVGDRKIAGILPEASTGRVRLGIGINVNQSEAEMPEETVKPATSLRIETGRELERAPLLAEILLELEHRYYAWQSRY